LKKHLFTARRRHARAHDDDNNGDDDDDDAVEMMMYLRNQCASSNGQNESAAPFLLSNTRTHLGCTWILRAHLPQYSFSFSSAPFVIHL